MRSPGKHLSFSGLIEAIERGGVEARARLIELSHHRPRVVLPYARELAALLDSSRAPVRKASIEMLAALSRVSPTAMAFLLPTLHNLLANEPQQAIANHAIEILANYARTSEQAARKVIPVLRTTLSNLGPKSTANVIKVLKELTK
jgi:hypothetical protein